MLVEKDYLLADEIKERVKKLQSETSVNRKHPQ